MCGEGGFGDGGGTSLGAPAFDVGMKNGGDASYGVVDDCDANDARNKTLLPKLGSKPSVLPHLKLPGRYAARNLSQMIIHSAKCKMETI